MPLNSKPLITTDRCLLVFDIHQNVRWLDRILNRELDSVTHVLLGGDYFDAYSSEADGAGAMAQRLRSLREQLDSKLTVLLGNHDIQYLEALPWAVEHIQPEFNLRHAIGEQFSYHRAQEIASILSPSFWNECRLFQMVNGHFVSHAGMRANLWPGGLRGSDALKRLDLHCTEVLKNLDEDHPILATGFSRGGSTPSGGITWMDFDFEFQENELPWPQIVGHTAPINPNLKGLDRARRKGDTWCLDGCQSVYGILSCDGSFEAKVIGSLSCLKRDGRVSLKSG